jgi:hypothetical protein
MRGIAVYSFAVAAFLWCGQMVSRAELIIDGVPIPDDAHVSAATPSASETQKRLLEAWVGALGGSLRHILITGVPRIPNGVRGAGLHHLAQ